MRQDIAKDIEIRHNVYVDAESEMYTTGNRDDETGWMPIPDEWEWLDFKCEECGETIGYFREFDDCVFDVPDGKEMNVVDPSFISSERPYYAKSHGRCFCADCWEKM